MRRSEKYKEQGLPVPPEELRRMAYGLTSLSYSPLALYSLLNSVTPGFDLPGGKSAGEIYDKVDTKWRDIMDTPQPENLLSGDTALELLGSIMVPSQLAGMTGKWANKLPKGVVKKIAKAASMPLDMALTTSPSLKGKVADFGIGYGLGGGVELMSRALAGEPEKFAKGGAVKKTEKVVEKLAKKLHPIFTHNDDPYIYHGTRPENVSKILKEGLVPSIEGIDGPGVYFANRPDYIYNFVEPDAAVFRLKKEALENELGGFYHHKDNPTGRVQWDPDEALIEGVVPPHLLELKVGNDWVPFQGEQKFAKGGVVKKANTAIEKLMKKHLTDIIKNDKFDKEKAKEVILLSQKHSTASPFKTDATLDAALDNPDQQKAFRNLLEDLTYNENTGRYSLSNILPKKENENYISALNLKQLPVVSKEERLLYDNSPYFRGFSFRDDVLSPSKIVDRPPAVWLTESPAVAAKQYSHGQNIDPLLIRKDANIFHPMYEGDFVKLQKAGILNEDELVDLRNFGEWGMYEQNKSLVDWLKKEGYDGWMETEGGDSLFGAPGDWNASSQVAILNPSVLRHPGAAFDPAKRGQNGLFLSNAALISPLAALGASKSQPTKNKERR